MTTREEVAARTIGSLRRISEQLENGEEIMATTLQPDGTRVPCVLVAKKQKPLGVPAYGSIPHLPGSKLGPGDHHISEGQARICTVKARDRRDVVFITEKLDGTCVAVANINGEIVPLMRAGYYARDSKFQQHWLFADWVENSVDAWKDLLRPGERACGEWLIQAHGTKYNLHYPLFLFDIMNGDFRVQCLHMRDRVASSAVSRIAGLPHLISQSPMAPESALDHLIPHAWHCGTPEGVVYRVERDGHFDFMAKWVRPDFQPGKYLESVTGKPPVWNFLP